MKKLRILLVVLGTWMVASVGLGQECKTYWQTAIKTHRPLFVFFTADWCTWCHKMQSETFTDAKVKECLSQNYVVYYEKKEDQYLVENFGVQTYPSYYVIEAGEKPKFLLKGNGFKNAADFMDWQESVPRHPIRNLLKKLF